MVSGWDTLEKCSISYNPFPIFCYFSTELSINTYLIVQPHNLRINVALQNERFIFGLSVYLPKSATFLPLRIFGSCKLYEQVEENQKASKLYFAISSYCWSFQIVLALQLAFDLLIYLKTFLQVQAFANCANCILLSYSCHRMTGSFGNQNRTNG